MTEDPKTVRALFYGLGADGTVGANKNSIKIIGEDTENFAQGYFVYDSKKSGSVTTSHLRFGPKPLRSVVSHLQRKLRGLPPVLIPRARGHAEGRGSRRGVPAQLAVWSGRCLGQPAQDVQKQIIEKKLKFYVIDGYKVAKETGMGGRINTIMQTCFFAISGVLPREEAIEAIKYSIKKTYGKRGESVVQKNYAAVDATLAHLKEVKVPGNDLEQL